MHVTDWIYRELAPLLPLKSRPQKAVYVSLNTEVPLNFRLIRYHRPSTALVSTMEARTTSTYVAYSFSSSPHAQIAWHGPSLASSLLSPFLSDVSTPQMPALLQDHPRSPSPPPAAVAFSKPLSTLSHTAEPFVLPAAGGRHGELKGRRQFDFTS